MLNSENDPVNISSPRYYLRVTIDKNFLLLANAVLNAIKVPMDVHYSTTAGSLVNGQWTGAFGRLVNNESDAAVRPFTATYERFRLAQLSTTLGYASPVAIMTGKLYQKSMRSDFHVFTTFSSGVWFGIVGTLSFDQKLFDRKSIDGKSIDRKSFDRKSIDRKSIDRKSFERILVFKRIVNNYFGQMIFRSNDFRLIDFRSNHHI